MISKHNLLTYMMIDLRVFHLSHRKKSIFHVVLATMLQRGFQISLHAFNRPTVYPQLCVIISYSHHYFVPIFVKQLKKLDICFTINLRKHISFTEALRYSTICKSPFTSGNDSDKVSLSGFIVRDNWDSSNELVSKNKCQGSCCFCLAR